VEEIPLSHTKRHSNVGTYFSTEDIPLGKSRRESHSDRPVQVLSYVQKIPLKHTGAAMATQNVNFRLRTRHPSKERIVE
jgi:hypothetical protein